MVCRGTAVRNLGLGSLRPTLVNTAGLTSLLSAGAPMSLLLPHRSYALTEGSSLDWQRRKTPHVTRGPSAVTRARRYFASEEEIPADPERGDFDIPALPNDDLRKSIPVTKVLLLAETPKAVFCAYKSSPRGLL